MINRYSTQKQGIYPYILKKDMNTKYAHVFWKGYIGRKHLFSLKSFITTMRSNWTIYIWIDQKINFSQSAKIQIPKLGIILNTFVWEDEIIDTPFEWFLNRKNPWTYTNKKFDGWDREALYSDWVRLVLLYKYGGVYIMKNLEIIIIILKK